jgi:hypothetical protein
MARSRDALRRAPAPARAAVLAAALAAGSGCANAPTPEPATEDDVIALEPAALAGDRAAVRALFELRCRCDGAVLEIDDMILGSTIRPWPQLFLMELQRYERDGGRAAYLDGMLCNKGPGLVDEFELQRREALLRIAALQSIDAADLAEVRDRCIATLRQDAAGLANAAGGEESTMIDPARMSRTLAQLAVHGTNGRAVLGGLRTAHPGVEDAHLRHALTAIAHGAPSAASTAAAAALCALAGIDPLAVAERRHHARETLTDPQWFAWIAGYGYHWVCNAGLSACYFEFDERQFADRVRVYDAIGAVDAAAAVRAGDLAFGAAGPPASLEGRIDALRTVVGLDVALRAASERFWACGDEIFTRVLLYCLEHADDFRS